MKAGSLAIVAALALAISACVGRSTSQATPPPAPLANTAPAAPPPPPARRVAANQPAHDDAIGMMAHFADEICACADRACGDRVNDDLMSWGQELAKHSSSASQGALAEGDAKQIAASAERFSKCLTDLMVASSTATP